MSSEYAEIYGGFLHELEADEDVIAVILAGSRARGLQNDRSDTDIYIIFRDTVSADKIREYDKNLNAKYGESIVLDISNKALMTEREFAHYAELDTAYYYDRYNLVHCKIEVDKSNGRIAKPLTKITTISPDEQKVILRNDLGEYISLVYQAMKSHEAGRKTARLDSAESVKYLLSSLFTLHNRVRPYNKYLEWELATHPLTHLPWAPEDFLAKLTQITAETDMKSLQEVYVQVEKLARQKGFAHKYDDWGEKIKYVNNARF